MSGVMGMKWGRRKRQNESSDLDRKTKMLYDGITKKKIRVKENVFDMSPKKLEKFMSSPAMKRKLKTYEDNKKKAKVQKIVALSIIGLYFFGPSIVNAGGKTISFAAGKHADSILNKYGGHVPTTVVNAKIRDLTPVTDLLKI